MGMCSLLMLIILTVDLSLIESYFAGVGLLEAGV